MLMMVGTETDGPVCQTHRTARRRVAQRVVLFVYLLRIAIMVLSALFRPSHHLLIRWTRRNVNERSACILGPPGTRIFVFVSRSLNASTLCSGECWCRQNHHLTFAFANGRRGAATLSRRRRRIPTTLLLNCSGAATAAACCSEISGRKGFRFSRPKPV